MKIIFSAIIAALIFVTGCTKNKCNSAVVTQTGSPCSFWGIRINDKTYPADSIPSVFKQEGILVCVKYELYDDMRLCVCCGGKWAHIISMRWPDE